MSQRTADAGKPLHFAYTFTLPNGAAKRFEVRLNRDTLAMVQEPRASYPEWTNLTFHRCPGCPLDEARHPRCPVAVNITDLIDFFKDLDSFVEADVRVETEARAYSKHTTLQKGASSLIGLYMVTSGCPVLDKLRPMADTHLPFATTEETTYRTLSMYVLAQHFLYKRGKAPDWEMKGLVAFLSRVQEVNTAFCKRLGAIGIKDASLNAVVILNTLGMMTGITIEEDTMDRLRGLFKAYDV